MKKYIFSALFLCTAGALSSQVDLVISTSYAAVDPVPGIDIIVERDPEDEPISVGDCVKKGLVIVKNNKGQWTCVTKAWAGKKYPSNKIYSIRDYKNIGAASRHKNRVKFKAGADLAGKVN